MAKFKIILRTFDTNKDGTHPVCLRIAKDGQKKFIGLGLTATPQQWADEFGRYIRDKRINLHYEKNNVFLNELETRAEKTIKDFEDDKIDWTLNQFEDAFLHRAKKGRVKPFFLNQIKVLRETGHDGNANCYQSTLNMLELFDKNLDKKVFPEIDLKYIKAFDVFMQMPRETVYVSKKGNERVVLRKGCSGNTRMYYLKALRAVLNLAIQAKEASLSTYPFNKGGFEIAKLGEETEIRYLPSNLLVKVKNDNDIELKNTLEYARKLFLFSYYCYGMSFVDMAGIKPDNIKTLENGQYIVYRRSKTNHNKDSRSISIKLTEDLKKIIADLDEIKKPVDDYLLPIVTREGLDGNNLYKHVRNRLKRFNEYLESLAEKLEIDEINLTSYVSRHTMAMTLQNNGVKRELISQILDHKDMKTTNTYLDSFANAEIDDIVKVL